MSLSSNLSKHVDCGTVQDFWALQTLYPPAIWLAKASLLFQFKRKLAPTKSGPVYWAYHILIWGNLAFYSSVFLATILECHPRHNKWIPSSKGCCVDSRMLLIVSDAINIPSDLMILLLPLWKMWDLRMTSKEKAATAAIFATGLL